MKWKKVMALGMASAMSLSVFAGCSSSSSGSGNTTAAQEGTEAGSGSSETAGEASTNATSSGPITLTAFSQLANYSGEQMGYFADILLKKFNVKLNIVQDMDGQLATRMQAGDLGDLVIFGSDGKDYQAAIEQGLLLNWNSNNLLAEHGSYIQEHMQNALQKNADMNGGIVYGFGHNVSASAGEDGTASLEKLTYTWDTRWDLYNELGQPEVKDLDGYLDLMLKMKELSPTDENGKETYAASLWPDWDGNMVMYIKAMVTAYYGYDELGIGLYDPQTGTYHDCMAEDGPYIEMLRFFNKLNQNNLLDPNSMTQTYEDMSAKMTAGGVFFSIFGYAGNELYNTEEHIKQNKMMLPLIPEDATPIAYELSTMGGNRVWGIGAKTEYPELCMDIINWLCTPEGTMTYYYGPQEVCWDYDDEGYAYLTDFGLESYVNKDIDMIGPYAGMGTRNDGSLQINNTTWSISSTNPGSKVGETFDYLTWKLMQADPVNEIEGIWRDFSGATTSLDYLKKRGNYVLSPATTFSDSNPSDEELLMVWNSVTDEIVNGSWKAIFAKSDEEFEQVLADTISAVNGYGYDRCVEFSSGKAEIRHQLEEALK